ncbi:MAG: zinc ABC transporter substrate-binding protein [Phycisphaeraceae bacterium]|nr:zinc ABC transporter substrate-binding protein [Phycisphaeraceae bacterium]
MNYQIHARAFHFASAPRQSLADLAHVAPASLPHRRAAMAVLAAMLAWVAFFAGGCSDRAAASATRSPGPMRVVVTLAPLEGLVRPLLPENATVRVLIPPGRSEHGYEPTVQDILALEQADVVVLVGMGLESSVDAALRKRPRPYRHEARLGVILGLEDAHGGHGHDHHAHDAHAHDDHADHDHDHHDHSEHAHAIDPHVWLDPILVKQFLPEIARLVRVSVSESNLGDAEAIAPALASLLSRVDEVDGTYRRDLSPIAGRAIVTHHAAFGRLAERYGLRVVEVIRPVEGAEPTPANLAQVTDAISREGVRAIFVEPQFDARGAVLIAQRAGVRLGTLDPLGTGDWFAMMEANLRSLVSNLSD